MPGTRILVVENNRSITKFVELELKHRDFDVRCGYDGQEALEQLE
jgi:DNA-binding response OmpR family regulator